MIGNRKKAMLRRKGKKMLDEWEIKLPSGQSHTHLIIRNFVRRGLYK